MAHLTDHGGLHGSHDHHSEDGLPPSQANIFAHDGSRCEMTNTEASGSIERQV
jgi:hypothetical protein